MQWLEFRPSNFLIMALLDRRNNDQGIVEGRFIKAVLEDQGKAIYSDINKLKARFSFTNPKWDKATVNISDDTMTYSAAAAERFVDMKTRKVKGYTKGTRKVPAGKIKKKIVFPIHNKVMWTHKKFIIKTLSFGFTGEVREQFQKLAKDEGLL